MGRRVLTTISPCICTRTHYTLAHTPEFTGADADGAIKCNTINRPDVSFLFSSGICSGLREVRIQIPTAVKKGDSAILNCWYDTEGDPLYAVKWYKGGREFYRYAPNENPAVKTFPIGNLTVKVRLLLPACLLTLSSKSLAVGRNCV